LLFFNSTFAIRKQGEIPMQVIYNGDGNSGGSVPVDSTVYAAGAAVAVAANTGSLVKTGATFAYWNTAANGSGTVFAPGAVFHISANVTLFAQWYVTSGLIQSGVTPHFAFSYDSSLQKTAANPLGLEPSRTNALIDACENDYKVMASWFGGISLPFPARVSVQVANLGGGAGWGGPSINLKPGAETSDLLRYLMVSEVTEMFMLSQKQGWFAPDGSNEQSCGEGLSRFLAQQFLVLSGLGVSRPNFAISPSWLNSSLPATNPASTQVVNKFNYGSRTDYVNHIREFDNGIDPSSGCAMLFLYYLQVQLAFSINRIIAAAPGLPNASKCLAGVYQNLTQDSGDPFPFFKKFLDAAFPPNAVSEIPGPNPDNPWPLWSQQAGIAFPGSTRLASPLVALSRTPRQEDVFWVGLNGDVSNTWRNDNVDNGIWHQQIGIAAPNSVRPNSPLVALGRTPNSMDVFWFPGDNSVASAFFDGKWHPSFGIAAPNTVRSNSPLVAFARTPNNMDVFWIPGDNSVASTFFDGKWHPSFGIAAPNTVRADSPLVALARAPNNMDVFWFPGDNSVASTFFDGKWHPSFGIAAPNTVRANSPLVAIARTPGNIDVFWFPGDNSVATASFDGKWHSSFGIAAPNSVRANSPLTALARTPNNIDVFWVPGDNSVATAFFDGKWHPSFGIAIPNSVRADSPLVTVSRTPQRQDVFWIGVDGDVSNTWRDDNIDAGRWHTQRAVAFAGSVRVGSALTAFARTPETIEVFWSGTNGDVSTTLLG
jgi:hypothetical protein